MAILGPSYLEFGGVIRPQSGPGLQTRAKYAEGLSRYDLAGYEAPALWSDGSSRVESFGYALPPCLSMVWGSLCLTSCRLKGERNWKDEHQC